MEPADTHASNTHETTDADVGLLAKLGVFGSVVILIVIAAMLLLFRQFLARGTALDPEPSPYAASPAPHDGPELQTDAASELRAIRAREELLLATYGWIDRERRIVRIPIERAKELLLERAEPPDAEPENEVPQ